MRLLVRVIPSATKNEVVGWMADGCLKIKIAAPPVDGKANQELLSFLAASLNVSKYEVEIVAGRTSKKKILRVPIDEENLINTLTEKFFIAPPTTQSCLF
jgi:hypothetical protein